MCEDYDMPIYLVSTYNPQCPAPIEPYGATFASRLARARNHYVMFVPQDDKTYFKVDQDDDGKLFLAEKDDDEYDEYDEEDDRDNEASSEGEEDSDVDMERRDVHISEGSKTSVASHASRVKRQVDNADEIRKLMDPKKFKQVDPK